MDAGLRRRYHIVAFRLAEGAGKLVSKRTKRRFRAQPQSSPVTRTSKRILIRLPPLLGTRCSVFFFRQHFCWNQNNRPVVFNRLGSYNDYSHRPAQTLSNAYEPCRVSNWNSPFSSENAITNARPGHPCMIHVCTCKPSLLYIFIRRPSAVQQSASEIPSRRTETGKHHSRQNCAISSYSSYCR
jgi:hypothetical protein